MFTPDEVGDVPEEADIEFMSDHQVEWQEIVYPRRAANAHKTALRCSAFPGRAFGISIIVKP